MMHNGGLVDYLFIMLMKFENVHLHYLPIFHNLCNFITILTDVQLNSPIYIEYFEYWLFNVKRPFFSTILKQ